MGILLMENFDVADLATLAGQRTLYTAPAGSVQGTDIRMETYGTILSFWGLNTFTEKGVRRTGLRTLANFIGTNGGNTGLLRIPLPGMVNGQNGAALNRSYYLSMRLRFLKGTTPTVADAAVLPVMDRPQVYLSATVYPSVSLGNTYSAFTITNATYNTDGNIANNRLWAGPGVAIATPHVDFKGDADGWFHVEVFKPAGSGIFTVWVNDFMYVAATAVGDVNQTNANTMYLNLCMGRTQTLAGNPMYYGYEITDVIVIDPTTAGQKYRFGSSGRVLSLDYSSDIANDWAADASATLAHRQMMMIDKSVPDANNILTGTVVGQREQYGMVPIPSDFGPYVPAVVVRPRVANGGAAAHGLAMEMDWGQGNTEVSSRMVPAGGAYDTNPLIMTTKPNGDPWTAADFASAKAGFSVKS